MVEIRIFRIVRLAYVDYANPRVFEIRRARLSTLNLNGVT